LKEKSAAGKNETPARKDEFERRCVVASHLHLM
jgi:hypothetical protein